MKKAIYILLFTAHLNGYAQTWNSVTSGVNDNAWSLSVYNAELYVGGMFDSVAGIPCNKMAKWNGITWSTIPNVPGGDNISAFEPFNGELYMGRGNPPFIHRWDGASWSFAGSGLNSVAIDMIEFNAELYAGGLFTTAGGIPANHIAKWNGTSWSNVGAGMNDDVLTFAVYNGELYAGGRFDTIGVSVRHRIAKWNGSSWIGLGAGITGGQVNSMAVYNGELYVGGGYTTAGGIASPGIARWNGVTWNTVSTGILGYCIALEVYNGELYAGGYFTSAGGVLANNIAKWDGTNWSVLGSGITGYVSALKVYNNELYVSGIMTDAGGIPVNNIARWSTSAGIEDFKTNSSLKVSPNPFSNELLIEGTNQNGKIVIIDLTGKEIMVLNTSDNETKINAKLLIPGFYFLRYEEQTKSEVLKVMKF